MSALSTATVHTPSTDTAASKSGSPNNEPVEEEEALSLDEDDGSESDDSRAMKRPKTNRMVTELEN